MDDFASKAFSDFRSGFAEADPEDEAKTFIIGVVHFILGSLLVYAVKKCCCRNRAPVNTQELTAQPEHLQPKKRVLTGYCLLFTGGFVGAHHFYLERIVHGLLASWTLNFFFVGWLLDLVLLPSYVRGFNNRRTDASAPSDGSQRAIFIKLPALALIIGVSALLLVAGGPWILHHSGAVDIDRIAAQTVLNPYDTLGIARSSGLAEAKSAYRKVSLKWHPDRNPGCGKECDDKMSEITKAFDLIKKRQAPVSSDQTWQSWFQDLGRDWWYVMEVMNQHFKTDEEQKQEEKKSARTNRKPNPSRNRAAYEQGRKSEL